MVMIADWENIYQERGIIQREIMPVVKEFVKELFDRKNQHLKILDSGCGTGRHTVFVADYLSKNKGVEIESIDSSKTAISLLKSIIKENRLNSKINLKVHNLSKGLPYEDNHFDGIISTLVIEHNKVKGVIIRCSDMKRVLKHGGLLAFSVPSIEDPRYLTGDEVEPRTKINTPQADGDIPHHFFTDKEIELIFKGYKVLYKKLQARPSFTAGVTAQHWEYLFEKL